MDEEEVEEHIYGLLAESSGVKRPVKMAVAAK